MIPLRVRVEGFLSYRDPAELNFAEAPLWMLTGPNGAGKSTVFDAITLALFDAYRGDKQHHQELVNQQCDSLKVEFEFQLGDDVYCARRIIPRKGTATQHIEHVSGPAPTRPTRKGLSIVDTTTTETGFNKWVADHIGLDVQAFTASMLLQQGHADALIEMKPKVLHETFAQLVDLRAYERLHERIEGRRKQHATKMEACQLSLQGIPVVTDADVQVLAERIQTLQGQADDAQALLTGLSDLKVKAAQWQLLSQQRDRLVAECERIDQLLNASDVIERDARRFDDLKDVFPHLESLHSDRVQMAKLQEDIRDCAGQLQSASAKLEETRAEAGRRTQEYEALKTEHGAQREALDAAKFRRQELEVDLQAIVELEKLRQELAAANRSLANFRPDLDEQVRSVEVEIERLSTLKASLPWLTQFVQAKQTCAKAEAQERNAEQRVANGQKKATELEAREVALRPQHEQALTHRDDCQSHVHHMQAQADELHKRFANLQAVEGKPNCPYCGQPLTPAHIEREQEALAESLDRAGQAVTTAKHDFKNAHEQCDQLQQKLKTLAGDLQTVQNERRDADKDLAQARKDKANSQQTVEQSFAHLSPELQARIQPNGLATVTELMTSTFPTQQALKNLQKEVEALDARARDLQTLREQLNRRERLRAQHDLLTRNFAENEPLYPPERIQQVRDEGTQLDQRIQQVSPALTRLEKDVKSAGAKDAHIKGQIKAAEERHQQLCNKESGLSAQRDMLEARTNQCLSGLPAAWQSIADALTAPVLVSHREELNRLRDAPVRLQELRSGRQSAPKIKHDLEQTEAGLAAIPVAAHVPAEALEQQERETQAHTKQLNQELSQARSNSHTLEDRRAQRQRLEQERTAFARRAYLCKELAQLLGRDGLQRHLLEQTYEAIVDNANCVLDRLSAGDLKLEFQVAAGTEAGKARHANLVAYHRPSGAKPIPLRCLSGGQRFRVAIALALGIGQYATREAQQVEAVIIDEGFGSLDETGRQEMIDAMHALKTELKRIIIVSHQLEFAKAFPNRYEIEFRDGTSHVRLA